MRIAAKNEAPPPVVKPLPIGWVVTSAAGTVQDIVNTQSWTLERVAK